MSPPAQTTVGVIALAVTKLQAKLFPFRLTKAVSAQFEYLGPRMPFAMKMIFANMWLFGPLVIKRLSATMMASSLRTTTAPTMSSGGPQDNVLPQHASAIVNFRILQGDTVKSVIERSRRLIGDPRVKIATFGPCVTDPSPVSPVDNWAFGIISRTIREVMFDALVTPALVAGGTDTVFYRDLAECTYRFVPVRLPVEEISAIHGFDERISVDNYAEMICFYIRLLHNSCD
jgi:carboxypeptidase PM20D1